MKSISRFITVVLLFVCYRSVSQSVVVNGYFNAADPRDEWIELLVTTDNTDMRSWTIRDNNGSQNSWQTAVTFQNIAFWNNMRAGTVIMIWNRVVSSTGISHATIDVNKADGYIELSAQDATYFTGGSFGSSPTWAGNTLNVAGSGEIIELRNSSGTHIHGLGHLSPAGSDWTGMSTPKLNHANNASSGDAIYVCPGASLSDYNGPATGNAFTSKNSGTITFGLPNTCGASSTGNAGFWNSLREPTFSAQTITPTVTQGNPGSLSFSWSAATDPNSSDNTTSYLILKNNSNSFTAPSDGTTYAVGNTIGTATVVAQTSNSTTLSHTDNTINSANCYYYRVYAFRYGTDELAGNSYDASRGRAYNQSNFAEIECLTIILPVELISFSVVKNDRYAQLKWKTATELNSKFFVVERSSDGITFETIDWIQASGYSNKEISYSTIDYMPMKGISYYRLKQIDINGAFQYSSIVSLSMGESDFIMYPNPSSTKIIQINCPFCENETHIELYDAQGNKVLEQNIATKENILDLSNFTEGIYSVRIYNTQKQKVKRLLLVK